MSTQFHYQSKIHYTIYKLCKKNVCTKSHIQWTERSAERSKVKVTRSTYPSSLCLTFVRKSRTEDHISIFTEVFPTTRVFVSWILCSWFLDLADCYGQQIIPYTWSSCCKWSVTNSVLNVYNGILSTCAMWRTWVSEQSFLKPVMCKILLKSILKIQNKIVFSKYFSK